METLIKKYFWTTNLLFLAAVAWLLSSGINAVIAQKVRSIPNVSQNIPKGRLASVQKTPVEDNQSILDRNYFGSAMAIKVETVMSGPILDDASAENLLKNGQLSNLRAVLVGTIVATDTRWSMAVLTDQSSSQTNIYRVGDPFMGEAKINSINSQRIYVLRNGALEYIELQEKGAKGAKPGPVHTIANAPPADAGAVADNMNIKQIGPDTYAIDRGEIDKTLSNLNAIAMQARIVPAFNNGESVGFKLFAIRPGSLYSKIGIENGDEINKINGFPMNSPDKALEVYQKLKSANSIEVEINRQGQKKKLTYQIR